MDRETVLVFLLNTAVNALLLLGARQLEGQSRQPIRTVMAAMVGGIHSAACLALDLRLLTGPLWRGISLLLMAGIAFGFTRTALRLWAVFILLAEALGGIALLMSRGRSPVLLPAMAGLWLLWEALPAGRGCRVWLTICQGDRCVRLQALRDTGNTLQDPITGERVLVISAEAAGELTQLSQAELRDPLGTLVRRPGEGLRLIPFRAVGTAGGLLLAKRFDRVRIGTRQCSCIVAFAPEGLEREHGIQALTGG